MPKQSTLLSSKRQMQNMTANVNEAIGGSPMQEPFYVVDLSDICRKVQLWRTKMPRVKPFYAVKCNPLSQVLKSLAHFGLGFSCASKRETEAVLQETNVQPSELIYANSCKTKSIIKHARESGVTKMTFDSIGDAVKIAENFPEAQLILQIRVEATGSPMQLGAERAIVPDLLKRAADLRLNIIGISFDLGLGFDDQNCFRQAISDARWAFDQAAHHGFHLSVLDLGGGFPGKSGRENLFNCCAEVISEQLEELFSAEKFPGLQIIAEPGEFMTASAFTLYTSVLAKRVRENCLVYRLTDGIYGSFKCNLFDNAKPEPIVVGRPDNRRHFISSLWGPTSDPLDIVHDGLVLPELEVGDWLLFKDMGAYTHTATLSSTKPLFHFVVNSAAEALLRESAIGKKLVEDFCKGTKPLKELIYKIRVGHTDDKNSI